MEQKQDIELICNRCNSKFIWTVKDQEFYERQGWTTQPKKCKKCRDERNKFKEQNGQ
jgi:hypothetical protein